MFGTVYGGPFTLPAAIVRIVLTEKQLPFNFVEIPWSPEAGYNPVHPIIAKHHPDQKNPVWIDDYVTLYDSFLICSYLDDRFGSAIDLSEGADSRARTRILFHDEPFDSVTDLAAASVSRAKSRSLFYDADRSLFPIFHSLVKERIYKDGTSISDAAIESALESFATRVSAAEVLGHYKLSPSHPSSGDVAAATLLNGIALLNAGLPGSCDMLMPWFKQITARPAFVSVFGDIIQHAVAAKLMPLSKSGN